MNFNKVCNGIRFVFLLAELYYGFYIGITIFSRPGPDPDKFGLSGTGLTCTGCINNADPGCNFSNPDILWVGSGFR